MSENTKPADDNQETPEVEAHSANVLDLQGTTAVEAPEGSCVSVLSVVLEQQ